MTSDLATGSALPTERTEGPDQGRSPVDGAPRNPAAPMQEAGQEAGRRDPGGGENALRAALDAARHIVAPTTFLTALLFYFGWVHMNARALYFGLDPSALGFSTQDYLLRSIEPVFVPLAVLLIAGLLLVAAHVRLSRWASGAPARRTGAVAVGLAAVGTVLVLVAAAGWANRPVLGTDFLITPLSLGVGPALMLYAARFRQRFGRRPATAPNALERRASSLSTVLVGCLLVVNLFGAIGDWADAAGRGRARHLAANLAGRPGVVVYTAQRLQISGPGVVVDELPRADAAYQFRYSGLKLLVRSGGKYFLLPKGWTPTDGQAIVLPDSEEIRYEFTPT